MHLLKKYFLFVLFGLSVSLFATGNAHAQTWTQASSTVQNGCVNFNNGQGQCQCNTGYSRGTALAGNCSYDGAIIGCWNPSSGKCQECGTGGTVVLGQQSCFNSGQGNQGGTAPGPVGVSCTNTTTGNTCIGAGPSSGGYSTN